MLGVLDQLLLGVLEALGLAAAGLAHGALLRGVLLVRSAPAYPPGLGRRQLLLFANEVFVGRGSIVVRGSLDHFGLLSGQQGTCRGSGRRPRRRRERPRRYEPDLPRSARCLQPRRSPRGT